MPSKRCATSAKRSGSCSSAPLTNRMACQSRCEIRVQASRRRFLSTFSRPSTRRSLAVWGWACRSAVRSSKRTAADCGRARTCPAAPAFNSPCRRSQTLRRDAALVSRPKEQATRPRVLLWVKLRKPQHEHMFSALPWRSQRVDATLYLEGEMECGLMSHKFHRGFTAAEKTELWDRWKRGESLKAIGRAFGKQSSSIYFLVAPHGGIRPAERRRCRLALTLAEREVISRGVTAHQSARSIAKLLGRSPSTVSREMSRNGGCDRYRAALADENAWARARRPKCCKLANSPRLRRAVAGKLRLDWSPEQIAGWLKRTHPEDECNQVSHETIYLSLFLQTRGVLKKEQLGEQKC